MGGVGSGRRPNGLKRSGVVASWRNKNTGTVHSQLFQRGTSKKYVRSVLKGISSQVTGKIKLKRGLFPEGYYK